MDGGRAQTVLAGIAKGGERRLERDLKELCENKDSNTGCEPCSEVLPSKKQP